MGICLEKCSLDKVYYCHCFNLHHLLGLQDVVLQVLHQLWSVVLVEQEVLLLLRQRRHDAI